MRKASKWILVVCMAIGASWAHVAAADVNSRSAANAEEGDNASDTSQSGGTSSGDAVAGQVVGVVSAGDTSVDATNRSVDVSVSTGDADAFNTSRSIVGLSASTASIGVLIQDIISNNAVNVQEGDNSSDLSQDASATTGDGVAGEVIGVVTSADGSADLVVANTSQDAGIKTGDALFSNNADGFILTPTVVDPDPCCPLP
jgi:hypothetical protein